MRAIQIQRHGGPDVLVETAADAPPLGPADVLVGVAVAGVNFVDVYIRTGRYPTRLPYTPESRRPARS